MRMHRRCFLQAKKYQLNAGNLLFYKGGNRYQLLLLLSQRFHIDYRRLKLRRTRICDEEAILFQRQLALVKLSA